MLTITKKNPLADIDRRIEKLQQMRQAKIKKVRAEQDAKLVRLTREFYASGMTDPDRFIEQVRAILE